MKVVYRRIDRPSTTSLLCRFAQQELPGFEFSSIQVNKARWTAPEMEVQVDLQSPGPGLQSRYARGQEQPWTFVHHRTRRFIDIYRFIGVFFSDICCSWRRLFWRLAVAGWWQQIGSGQKHQEPTWNGRKWTQVNEFEDVHIWILIFTKSQDWIQWLCENDLLRNKWFKFDGRKPHCAGDQESTRCQSPKNRLSCSGAKVTPFSGRRYTLASWPQ